MGTHWLQGLWENTVSSLPRHGVADRFWASALCASLGGHICALGLSLGYVISCPHTMPSLAHSLPSQSPTPHTSGLTGTLLLVPVVSLVRDFLLLGHSL